MVAAEDWGQANQESEAEHTADLVERSVVWLGRVAVGVVEAVALVDLDWESE